jgi:hypothetical protein
MLMSSILAATVLQAADVSSIRCYDDLKVTVVKKSQLMPATIVKRRLIAIVPFCSSEKVPSICLFSMHIPVRK